MARFDKFSADNPTTEDSPPEPAPTAKPPVAVATNGVNGSKKRSSPSDEEQASDLSSVADSPPPKKKHKKSVELSDAALAARLQAEENIRNGRATRGVAKRKAPVKKVKKERKKKSKVRVGSEDDSDAESGEKKDVVRTGGFHVSCRALIALKRERKVVLTQRKQKPMALSEPLVALLGETQLSRPQTVKKIWAYIKAHDLQDPADRRQIRCDDALRTVFKSDRVHMFTMNKLLNQNLYAIEE
jgi:upstream activation factor subunit UAF30